MKKTASSAPCSGRSASSSALALAVVVVAAGGFGGATRAEAARRADAAPRGVATPAWLRLQAGTGARVDIAPWDSSDEPEAALTESADSLRRDFTADGSRPPDVVFEPIGVRVRIERVLAGGAIVRVHGIGGRWEAYTRTDRLEPEIPATTTLVVAGGFAGFADFYPTLATRHRAAGRVETGSRLTSSRLAAAPYDPDSSDLVRVRVRVTSGPQKGATGWVAVAYVGLPAGRRAAGSTPAEQSCSCRLVSFVNNS